MELVLIIAAIIYGLVFMIIAGALFLIAVRNQQGLNIGHIIAAIFWLPWLIYYLIDRKNDA